MTAQELVEFVARVVNELGPTSYRSKVAIAFAVEFKKTTPGFNTEQFLLQCGIWPDAVPTVTELVLRQVRDDQLQQIM